MSIMLTVFPNVLTMPKILPKMNALKIHSNNLPLWHSWKHRCKTSKFQEYQIKLCCFCSHLSKFSSSIKFETHKNNSSYVLRHAYMDDIKCSHFFPIDIFSDFSILTLILQEY